MGNNETTYRCTGCGMGCILAENEVKIYKKKYLEKGVYKYPNCGRNIKEVNIKEVTSILVSVKLA